MDDKVRAILGGVGTIILDKDREIRLILASFLAGGHVLIEDVPGTGKTTLAHAFSHILGLDFKRVQFTSDLLPADIIGSSLYDRNTGEFHFDAGPVFTNVLIADEINRTNPKTQSALLEAMEEDQVTSDGETRQLPQPFFVIATQNPIQQLGTFPLPESQLDRFLVKLSMGYPSKEDELSILHGVDRKEMMGGMKSVVDSDDIAQMKKEVLAVQCSGSMANYIYRIIEYTRKKASSNHAGLSPRAGIALLRAARAWAYIDGRECIVPEDVQMLVPYVVRHRVGYSQDNIKEMLEAIPVVV